jgi:hypothetical protein
MDRVPEAADDFEAGPVAPRPRQREAPGGDDDGRGRDRFASREAHRPGLILARRLEILDQGLETDLHGAPPREVQEAVAHLPAAVRDGKKLARVGLQRQRDSGLLLEEAALLGERPRAEDLAQRVGRGIGDETTGIEGGRENVAPPAAADQDFPAAIARAFEQQDAAVAGGREDGRQEAGGAGAEDDGGEVGVGLDVDDAISPPIFPNDWAAQILSTLGEPGFSRRSHREVR